MNRMIVLVVTLMVIAPISIIAQNSMPIMQAFVGRSGNSWFGKALVAFDFNADGYDDLFVHSRNAANSMSGVTLFNGSEVSIAWSWLINADT